MSETAEKDQPLTIKGEGETKIVRRTRIRIECDNCGEPADERHTYLLPDARRSPAWRSDHETFTCKDCKKNKFGGRPPKIEGYLWCSTFGISDRLAHMFLTWREEEIPESTAAAAPDMLAALYDAEATMTSHNLSRKHEGHECPWDFGDGFGGCIDVVRAALAKATGGAS